MNCTTGTIDDSKFNKPMPIIGLYIAGATLLCIIQMVRDLVIGFRSKQIWIPAKHFSIDAASLTIIGVAIKLSVHLNSPMPSKIDQLAKLSTSAFICIVLANILPSLGKLEKGELLANTIALAILIITSIVNIGIQLNTGVIQAFRIAHIVMLYIMCSFVIVSLYIAAFLPELKKRLQLRFEKLHQQALEVSMSGRNKSKKESLKKYLLRFSMMAQSSCPHFVLIRSPSNVNVLVFSLISASALLFVLFATINHKDKMVGLNTCSGESDYKWSVLLILIIQVVAVVVGLVFSFCRLFYNFRAMTVGSTSPPRDNESGEREKFWMQRLNRTKDDPVFQYMKDRLRSPFVYSMKQASRGLSFIFQLTARFSFLGNPLAYGLIFALFRSKNSNQRPDEDLRGYFLHVEGEEKFMDWMVLSSSPVTQKYMAAQKRRPQDLHDLLENHLSDDDFGGVYNFVSDRVPPLSVSDGAPPNCWSLPVLTLICIATALPHIDRTTKEQLKKSVIEGLVYVKLVEDNLSGVQDLVNIRAAANSVWLAFDREGSWIAIDLERLARNSKTPREVLSSLSESAKDYFSVIVGNQENDNGSSSLEQIMTMAFKILSEITERPNAIDLKKLLLEFWNIGRRETWVAVAAHSMYMICQTLLPDCENEDSLNPSSNEIFKKCDKIFMKLCTLIADIFGACFTNLRKSILLECERSTIEKRRETAFHVLRVFSETEEIMEILEQKDRKIPDLSDDDMASIDQWRKHLTITGQEAVRETEPRRRYD